MMFYVSNEENNLDTWGDKESLAHLVKEVSDLLSDSGSLSASKDFEFRPQQQEMAKAITEQLIAGESLLVEAGTGVGKSLAYLLPAITYAKETGRKCLISTHTINLQEQLMSKDIVLAQKILKADDLNVALLKGRQNYLCPQRLAKIYQQGSDLFSKAEARAEVERIWEWAEHTKTGTRSELDFSPSWQLWQQICSEPGVCTAQTCGKHSHCFYQEAKKQVLQADVVILNHALLFSLMAELDVDAPQEGFLSPNDFLIIDEAHTIEQVASNHLGIRVSQGAIKYQLQRLVQGKSKKGLLKTCEASSNAFNLVDELEKDIDAFFESVKEKLPKNANSFQREFRIEEVNWVPDILSNNLNALVVELDKIQRPLNAKEHPWKLEVLELARKIQSMANNIESFLEQDRINWVYWINPGSGEAASLSLEAAPIDMSPILGQLLFGEDKTSILTSATLSTEPDNLNYFAQRVGAYEVKQLKVGSPFDYESNMQVKVIQSMPERNDREHFEKMVYWIKEALDWTQGKTLVLFTSYAMMNKVQKELEPYCKKKGWALLHQDYHANRRQLLEDFKSDTNSVLLGTDSFWTGVDVPGEALSQVIITQLPFTPPSHPITEAKLQAMEANGKNPFMHYSVPEAVLKFSQGIGRLIRAKSDKGIVTVLDSRVVTKRYGSFFLKAMHTTNIDKIT